MTLRNLGALVALVALPAAAGEFVHGGNAGILARSFALPALGDPIVDERGRSEWRLAADVTNEYVFEGQDACARECLLLDAESARLRLAHRRNVGAGWDLSFEVPYLRQGGGFLDSAIEDWHDTFGLPNGGRELRAPDDYLVRYERDGAVVLQRNVGGDGFGDASIGLGRKLGRHGALRLLAKLPTGEADTLMGGNAGGAAWLDIALPLPPGWDGYVAGGLSLNARGDVLPDQQRRSVLFGGVGVLAPITDTVRLHVQLQGHTRLYDDSAMSPLAETGLPLTVGLQFRQRNGGAAFDIGFQEDPSVNGSPDFGIYMAITARPR